MDAWCAAFGAANVQPALVKLDLMPKARGFKWPADFKTFPDFQSGDLALYINGLVNYYSYG